MPLFSLPGNGGIGDFGNEAFRFIDRLEELGANYWQILPLNLVDKAGCPYASPSAFGAEPLLINAPSLGIDYAEDFSHEIDYEHLRETKLPLLKEFALKELRTASGLKKVEQFQERYPWANDLGVFLALKEAYGPYWSRWPSHLKDIESAQEVVFDTYMEEYKVQLFLQAITHSQWQKVKNYAELKNIQIIGDIPIFVSADSFDAWRWPEYFKIDPETGSPLVITGAPPDEFNEDGQLWGTVNYNWDHPGVIEWWLERLKYSQELYHLTRIDHFVGLYHVWESAPDASNAKLGEYVPSNGRKLLKKIEECFPELPFIAEDLGVLNNEIRKLREDFNYPTMRVYQFSLEEEGKPRTAPDVNEHMPKNVPAHSFYYTGTHDNNTLRGWLDDVMENPKQLSQIEKRFGKPDSEKLSGEEWTSQVLEQIVEDVLQSNSAHVILPLQDIFSLPAEARVNVPGTESGNWNWRLSPAQWEQEKWLEMKGRFLRAKRGNHDLLS